MRTLRSQSRCAALRLLPVSRISSANSFSADHHTASRERATTSDCCRCDLTFSFTARAPAFTNRFSFTDARQLAPRSELRRAYPPNCPATLPHSPSDTASPRSSASRSSHVFSPTSPPRTRPPPLGRRQPAGAGPVLVQHALSAAFDCRALLCFYRFNRSLRLGALLPF